MDATRIIEDSMSELRESIAGMYKPLAAIEEMEEKLAAEARAEIARVRRAGFEDGKRSAKKELIRRMYTMEQLEAAKSTAYAQGFADGVEQAIGRR